MAKMKSIILNGEDMISLFSKYYNVQTKQIDDLTTIGLVTFDEETVAPELKEILIAENLIFIKKK